MPTSILVPPFAIVSDIPPVNPITNKTLWWEPTTGMQWFWDGTYWLSTSIYHAPAPDINVNTSPFTFSGLGKAIAYNLFLLQWICSIRLSGIAPDVTNYHLLLLQRVTGSTGARTTVASISTNGLSSPGQHSVVQNLLQHLNLITSDIVRFDWGVTPVGTIPAIVQNHVVLSYRYARR